MRCQAASDSQNWCDYVVREGRLGPSPSNTISLLPASMEKHWSKKDTTLTSPRKYHLNLKYSVGLDYFWVFFKQIIFHFSEFQMYRSRLTVFLCLTPLSSASPWCLGIRYLSFIINYNYWVRYLLWFFIKLVIDASSDNQSRKRGFDVWKLHCREWCFYFEIHNARKTFLMHPDMIPENWTIWKNFLFSHCSHFVDALLLKSSACQRYKYALVTCTSPHFPHRPLNTALMPCGIWAVFIFHSVFFLF